MLREELTNGKESWYYVSFDGGHGVFVPGRGPTDAWVRMHALAVYADGATGTHGPIDDNVIARVPTEKRMVRLPAAEIEAILK